MKRAIAIAVMGLAAGAFSWDEYGPVATGKTEVDVMASQDFTGEATYPSLQVKYGIIDGLDVEASAFYVSSDLASGVGAPNLAVKYVHPELGLGAFVGVDFPVGSEEVVGTDPKTIVYPSLLISKVLGPVALNAWAMYAFPTDEFDNGKIDLYLKPQYNVTDKIGPYLGLQMYKYKDIDPFYVAKPGINYIVNEMISLEANYALTIPTAEGLENSNAGYAGVYFLF